MATLELSAIEKLRSLFEMELKRIEDKKTFVRDNPPARVDELIDTYDKQISIWRDKIQEELHDLLRFPPCHRHLMDKLKDFHQVAGYDKSVVIMTKFPDGNAQIDKELRQLITAVEEAVTQCGFTLELLARSRISRSFSRMSNSIFSGRVKAWQ